MTGRHDELGELPLGDLGRGHAHGRQQVDAAVERPEVVQPRRQRLPLVDEGRVVVDARLATAVADREHMLSRRDTRVGLLRNPRLRCADWRHGVRLPVLEAGRARIRSVVDTGLARVNRYSVRTKVQLLQIEKISRAAASQRSGRCGRVAAGICIRLYSEDDFARRPAYTDPEILRSSLASVILRMKSLRIGDIEDFPFLEAPGARMIADGYQLLAELGAVDENNQLTRIGWQLAKFPIDPRIARIILAAQREKCLPEALVIAAALSIQDPRERPFDRADAADRAQEQFQEEKSDFMSYLKLWRFYDEALKHRKSNRKLTELLGCGRRQAHGFADERLAVARRRIEL